MKRIGDRLRHQGLGFGNLGAAFLDFGDPFLFGRDRFGTAASSAGTFSVDYRDPASPALTGAARCVVVAVVTGRISVRRPTAGACA